MDAIIVDDEIHGRENLKVLLEKHCPSVTVKGLASNVFEANKLIELHRPDVVFLDVVMGLIDGISYLQSLKDKDFQVIIVSAHKDYAMKAMENGAFGYLLKPMLTKTLQEQVHSLERFYEAHPRRKKAAKSASTKAEEPAFLGENKIAITHSNGYIIADYNDIVRFEAQGNYSRIYMTDGTVLVTSKTLKRYNDQIKTNHFFRIHKSHFVNVSFIKEVINKGNGHVVLKDGTELPIAVLKRPQFNKFMKNKPGDM